MGEAVLFENGPTLPAVQPAIGGVPHLSKPVRNQMEFLPAELDSLIPEDHQVRTVWAYVEQADLSPWLEQIRVMEGGAGRPAIDPRVLLCLWLYATLDGVGSAHELAQLCTDHIVYRWICGGVSVNYHTLSDFRSDSEQGFDGLLTEGVVRLRAAGAVSMERVARDGTRIRASAGGGSFRRLKTLERFREEARAQVAALRQEIDAAPGAGSARKTAARVRAAREREARVAEALRQYPEAKAKKRHDKEETRVSITDPDARVMHMPDGGFRPAYNVQFSTDTGSQVIVGAQTINCGSDHGQLQPAVQELQKRYETTPREMLVDGGYAKPEDIAALAQGRPPCTVYSPVPELKPQGKPIPPPLDEAAEVKAWRERMKTPEAQEIYKERASTAECVNALAHNRGLQQFVVRGLKKVQAVVLLFALVQNLVRGAFLLEGGWEGSAGREASASACAGNSS
jgi:transposase